MFSALNVQIRATPPGDAKKFVCPKEVARMFPEQLHDVITVKFTLRGNTIGTGVKTGGYMKLSYI
jgi:hypothetical protein